jgi:hypothetical protein
MLVDPSHQICSPRLGEDEGHEVGSWNESAEDGWSQHVKLERWVRGGRALKFVHELLESGIDFNNLVTKLFLDVVYFGMNDMNVIMHFGVKGSKVNAQFLIGFFLTGGIHEGTRGWSTEKKSI